MTRTQLGAGATQRQNFGVVLGLWLGDKVNKLNSDQTKGLHIFIIELVVSVIFGIIIYGGIYLIIFSAIINR